MSEEADQHEQHDHEQHIVSPVLYGVILLVLLCATALTCGMSYIDLGEWHIAPGVTLFWNPVVALAIACTKMVLVVLFFMHIKYSTKLTKLVVMGGLIWLGIMIVLTLGDVMSRGWVGVPGR